MTPCGSSPLARGLHARLHVDRAVHRIIPARAGFTGLVAGCRPPNRDHPRSRGVYDFGPHWRYLPSGSSPLARGLPDVLLNRRLGCRIIPARAGFTAASGTPPGQSWDHPRSRGVYRTLRWLPGPGLGSSPLARGLRLSKLRNRRNLRIIPARAGFTRSYRPWKGRRADHPRSRGVYILTHERIVDSGGSSPLARGLPYWRLRRSRQLRIIPARAGFTSRW